LTFEEGHNLATRSNEIDENLRERFNDAFRLVQAQLGLIFIQMHKATFYFQVYEDKIYLLYVNNLKVNPETLATSTLSTVNIFSNYENNFSVIPGQNPMFLAFKEIVQKHKRERER